MRNPRAHLLAAGDDLSGIGRGRAGQGAEGWGDGQCACVLNT